MEYKTSEGINQYVGRILNDRYLLSTPIAVSPDRLSWVFKAADVSLRRDVALKLLRPHAIEDEEFLESFKIQAQNSAQLNHQHIARIYDWGIDGFPYLVTELCRGESLQVQLKNFAALSTQSAFRLSNSEIISIGIQCAEALSYAHDLGQPHLDLSPGNILFDADGRAKISDFGIAAMLMEKSVEKFMPNVFESLAGSSYYSAPEQLKSSPQEINEKVDIFSLSFILIEAAAGDFFYASDSSIGTYINRITEHLQPPKELEDLGEVLALGLKQDPQQRPSAKEFAWHLKGLKDYSSQMSLPIQISKEMMKAVEVDWGSYSSQKVPRRQLKKLIQEPGSSSLSDEAPELSDAAPEKDLYIEDVAYVEDVSSSHAVKAAAPRVKSSKTALVASAIVVMVAGALTAGSVYRWAGDTGSFAVPDLIGEDASRLDEISNKWKIRQFEGRSEDFAQGQIISIQPSPGSKLEKNSVLTAVISLGEPYALLPENLLGSSVSEAEQRLSGLGLLMGELFLADAQQPFQAQIPRVVISKTEAVSGSYIVTGFDVPTIELPTGTEIPLFISNT